MTAGNLGINKSISLSQINWNDGLMDKGAAFQVSFKPSFKRSVQRSNPNKREEKIFKVCFC